MPNKMGLFSLRSKFLRLSPFLAFAFFCLRNSYGRIIYLYTSVECRFFCGAFFFFIYRC